MEPKARFRRSVETLQNKAADGRIRPSDYRLIMQMAHAYDPKHPEPAPADDKTKAYSTLSGYVRYLGAWAERTNPGLARGRVRRINRTLGDILDDEHDGWDAPSENTVKSYSDTLRKFYRFHTDLEVDPDEIKAIQAPKTKVDETDVFDWDDIQAMRDAIDNPRDRCLFELFINTGQRLRAIQTLRVGDMDAENGSFELNSDADGLKGADANGRKRPLLGAEEYVRQWLEYHPTKDADDYLLCPLPGAPRGEPGAMLQPATIRRKLQAIAETAGVEKPANPHNFRHSFVTITLREYDDISKDDVRHIIGHGPTSKVMETTYSHIGDDERIKKVEQAMGIREADESNNPHVPPVCGCGKTLNPKTDKACPRCGTQYAADADGAKQITEEGRKAAVRDAQGADDGQATDLQTLMDILGDDEKMQALQLLADNQELLDLIGQLSGDGDDDEGAAGLAALS